MMVVDDNRSISCFVVVEGDKRSDRTEESESNDDLNFIYNFEIIKDSFSWKRKISPSA